MGKFTNLAFTLLLLLSVISCLEEDKISNPPFINQNNKTIILSDSTGRVGEKIIASIKNMQNYNLSSVYLNDKFVLTSEIYDSVYSIFIPYNASSGKYKFYFHDKDGNYLKDTILYSINFSVINDCNNNVCLDWNEGQAFVESDSWQERFLGDTVKWDSEIHSDTVIVKRNSLCGDECAYWHTLVFKNEGDDKLPLFLYAVRKVRMWLEPDIDDTLKSGVLKIDKWNSQSNYSGTFSYSDDADTWVFWVSKK